MFKYHEGWVDEAVPRGGGSALCLLLVPGEVVTGWGVRLRTVVSISEENGKGSVRRPKESREEGCDGC